jgi:hypothetical protein
VAEQVPAPSPVLATPTPVVVPEVVVVPEPKIEPVPSAPQPVITEPEPVLVVPEMPVPAPSVPMAPVQNIPAPEKTHQTSTAFGQASTLEVGTDQFKLEPETRSSSIRVVEDVVISDEPVELPGRIISQQEVEPTILSDEGTSIQVKKEDHLATKEASKPLPAPAVPGVRLEAPQQKEPLPEPKPDVFKEAKKHAAKKLAEQLRKAVVDIAKDEVENRNWRALNMVRANLVKEQRSLFYNWRSKLLGLAISSLLSLLIFGLALGALIIWENNKKKDNAYLYDNSNNLTALIKSQETVMDQVSNFNDRLLYVAYLLDNHLYWTNFFKMLEQRTTLNIYYEGFIGDTQGIFTIPTVAKDQRSSAVQLKVLQNFGDRRIIDIKRDNIRVWTNNVTTTPAVGTTAVATAPVVSATQPAVITPTILETRQRFDLKLTVNPKILLYRCFVQPELVVDGRTIKEGDKINGQLVTADSELVKKYCPYKF